MISKFEQGNISVHNEEKPEAYGFGDTLQETLQKIPQEFLIPKTHFSIYSDSDYEDGPPSAALDMSPLVGIHPYVQYEQTPTPNAVAYRFTVPNIPVKKLPKEFQEHIKRTSLRQIFGALTDRMITHNLSNDLYKNVIEPHLNELFSNNELLSYLPNIFIKNLANLIYMHKQDKEKTAAPSSDTPQAIVQNTAAKKQPAKPVATDPFTLDYGYPGNVYNWEQSFIDRIHNDIATEKTPIGKGQMALNHLFGHALQGLYEANIPPERWKTALQRLYFLKHPIHGPKHDNIVQLVSNMAALLFPGPQPTNPGK